MKTDEARRALCVVLARGGSKGLPDKNARLCAGRPVLSWTLAHALRSQRVARVVLTTDSADYRAIAEAMGVETLHRPHKLAVDTATIDSAARHAALTADPDGRFPHVVILYGNVPVRPADLTDRAVDKLIDTGCDSVQSVVPVGKHHPYWMKELGGDGDALLQHVPNRVYRRQDLPPLYQLDGGVIAVTRRALMVEVDGEPHAFLGEDRRAIVTGPGEVVDIDEEADLLVAEARLRAMGLDQRALAA